MRSPKSAPRSLPLFMGISIGLHAIALAGGAYYIATSPKQVHQPSDRISLGLKAASSGSVEQNATEAATAQPAPQEPVEDDPPEPVEDGPAPKPKKPPPKPQKQKKEPPKAIPPSQQPPVVTQAEATSGNLGISGSVSEQTQSEETGESDQIGAPTADELYDALILKTFKDAKRYPPLAKRRGLEGEAVILFTISRQGNIVSARVTSSSSPYFERAVLAQLRRAAPFPPAPNDTSWQERQYIIRVPFILDDA